MKQMKNIADEELYLKRIKIALSVDNGLTRAYGKGIDEQRNRERRIYNKSN